MYGALIFEKQFATEYTEITERVGGEATESALNGD
jgi:hypothetical protein